MSEVGSYLRVFDQNGSYCYAKIEEEPRIDAAVTQYVSSGGSRDSVIDIELQEGATYKILASHITGWFVSTPDTRRERIRLNKLMNEEEDRIAEDVGIKPHNPWDSP